MKTLSQSIARFSFGALALTLGICALGATQDAAAQSRDPFAKPVIIAPRKKAAPATGGKPAVKPVVKKVGPSVVVAPSIQQRIDSYRAMRQRCAELGIACPKPTTVLTLDEMQVTGIFRTPRGVAAMVEAVPIKLSYTIYPGEQFYDGQLVAIEESKLTFRRVTRMTDGKELVAADSKILRQVTVNDLTVPRVEPAPQPQQTAATGVSSEAIPTSQVVVNPVTSQSTLEVNKSNVPLEMRDTAKPQTAAPIVEEETAAPVVKPAKRGASKKQNRK